MGNASKFKYIRGNADNYEFIRRTIKSLNGNGDTGWTIIIIVVFVSAVFARSRLQRNLFTCIEHIRTPRIGIWFNVFFSS